MMLELKPNDFIISKTDKKGRLTYVNKIFMEIAEYTEEELLGKPHSIVRHPDMPKLIFKLLWDRVQNKEEIFAFVINKTKRDNDYWVFANVTASVGSNGQILGFHSVRRKPNPEAIEIIKPLYNQLLQAEKSGGIEASNKLLTEVLTQKGVDYDEFISNIQK